MRERDKGTEQRILEAAHQVFLRRGTSGARMQEIAAQAGVNQAMLHYYFRSKERLAAAVFRRAAERFLPSVLDILGSDLELEAKVERVVQLEVEHLRRSPYIPGYVLGELNHQPQRANQLVEALTAMPQPAAVPRILETLTAQLDARARAGTMRRMAADQFVIYLISLCVFPLAAKPMILALLRMDAAAFERFLDRCQQELAPFFLRGLRT